MYTVLRFVLGEPHAKRLCVSDLFLTRNPSKFNFMDIPEDILIRILGLVKQHILCFRVTSRDCLKLVDNHSFLKIFVVEHRLLKKMSEALHLAIKVDDHIPVIESDANLIVKYDQLIQDGWYYKMLGLKDPAVALKLLDKNYRKVVNRLNGSYASHMMYKEAKRKFLLKNPEGVICRPTPTNHKVEKNEVLLNNTPYLPHKTFPKFNFIHLFKLNYFFIREGMSDKLYLFTGMLDECRDDDFQVPELWKFIIINNPKLAFLAFKELIETKNPEVDRTLTNNALRQIPSSSLDSFFGQNWNVSIELARGDNQTEFILLDSLYRMFETQLNLKPSELVKDEIYKIVGQVVSFNCFNGEKLNGSDDFRLFNRSIDIIFSFNTCQILEIFNQMVQFIDYKLEAPIPSFDQNKFLASYIILAKLGDHRGVKKLIEKYRKCLFSLKIEKLKEKVCFILKLSEDIETLLQGTKEKTAPLKLSEIAEIYSHINIEQFNPLKIFVTLIVRLVDQKEVLEWIKSCNLTIQIKILGLLAENTYFKENRELLEYTRSFIPKTHAFSLTELFQFLPLLAGLDVKAALTLIELLTGKNEQFHKKYKIELLTNVVKLKNFYEEPSDNHLAAAELLIAELDHSILFDNLESYLGQESPNDNGQLVNLRGILESFFDGNYTDFAFNLLQKIEDVFNQENVADERRGVYFVKLIKDIKFLKSLRKHSLL